MTEGNFENRLLSTREAAEFLGVKECTLKWWRQRNYGPPFLKLTDGPKARVRYPAFDLQEWAFRRVTRPSGRLETRVAFGVEGLRDSGL
ncbi:MAG TPA: helix-turn-helix domain-containing protein [Terriglobia bacterium]|nr:helix-turn-helix domain-containing protein [Terriglobia bacterium]